ncbi:22173_t:CDS:2 [Entrophospora sp. SA101]|nr:12865_t:CDS:2 [Entrophospora sp. SA101]CAJ0759302.1 22173_t:CDS:2 [Entrophospora sp. SA101]CAJ0829455.1 16394_t:CDS:2 [Entrophospora sp. SA101]CAJ0880843.1 10687_t:CDS:2 [Entrophospora sp. SA101]
MNEHYKKNFQLFESIYYEPSKKEFAYLEGHFKRLLNSVEFFSNNPEFLENNFIKCLTKLQNINNHFENLLLDAIKEHSKLGENVKQIVKLCVDKDGEFSFFFRKFEPIIAEPVEIILDNQQSVSSDNIFLYHKTTNRDIYNEARNRRLLNNNKYGNLFDVLLYNEKKQITECTITNIAVEFYINNEQKSIWKTPKIECGLLPGVLRDYLIKNNELIPDIITIDDIKLAQKENRKIKCFNSVRGEFQAIIIIE